MTKVKHEPRVPLATDFGTYLKALRVDRGIPLKTIADGLNLKVQTISNIENNRTSTPHPHRIKIWLALLKCSDRLTEATALLRRVKRRRSIEYILRSEATEHLDRIIDAYEKQTLDPLDLALLKCIAPKEYRFTDSRPPSKERTKITPVPDIAFTKPEKDSTRKATSKPLRKSTGKKSSKPIK